MIARQIGSKILDHVKKMPVLAITGPRQSGKTTLVKHLFPAYQYLNLENPVEREFAETDPIGFLKNHSKGLILDEIQNAPALFSFIQTIVDDKGEQGKFILTGSNNFLLLEKITQSLAGRVTIFHLLPFSLGELSAGRISFKQYEEILWKGFYPRLHDKKLMPSDIYPSYIQSYIERDLRKLINVKNLNQFQRFLSLCSGRIGQIVNFSSISAETGVDYKTIQNWLSILETSYIVYTLPAWYKNFNKRITKSPKLYFYDTGIACYLLGINSPENLDIHFAKGALFENMIMNEIRKSYYNSNVSPRMYYWRENNGVEIDLIIDKGNKFIPIEIKSGRTVNKEFFKNLLAINKLGKHKIEDSFLIYGGDEDQGRSDISVRSWKNLPDIVKL
jgi:predicted AAA+ superfamily ATPase